MIWRRKRKPSEASAAVRAAEAELEKTRADTPMYRALAESLRELREANNFARAIQSSFRGGRL